jgi:hypothetical protein
MMSYLQINLNCIKSQEEEKKDKQISETNKYILKKKTGVHCIPSKKAPLILDYHVH